MCVWEEKKDRERVSPECNGGPSEREWGYKYRKKRKIGRKGERGGGREREREGEREGGGREREMKHLLLSSAS